MTENELMKLFIHLRRPIYWDPVPHWIKLSAEQLTKFNEIQLKWNAKISEIENQKMQELEKIVVGSVK